MNWSKQKSKFFVYVVAYNETHKNEKKERIKCIWKKREETEIELKPRIQCASVENDDFHAENWIWMQNNSTFS